jgi:hypothetical protein
LEVFLTLHSEISVGAGNPRVKVNSRKLELKREYLHDLRIQGELSRTLKALTMKAQTDKADYFRLSMGWCSILGKWKR